MNIRTLQICGETIDRLRREAIQYCANPAASTVSQRETAWRFLLQHGANIALPPSTNSQ